MGEKENNNNLNESPVAKWLRNAVLGATMADLPAMMTASGWRLNEKGDYVLDLQNDPHVKLLRDNLATEGIGVMGEMIGLPIFYKLSKPINNYTLDIINLLGKRKTKYGHSGNTRSMYTLEFSNYLKKLGVDVSLLSDEDLKYLQHLRQLSVEQSVPSNRVVLVDHNHYSLYENGSEIGELDTYIHNGKQSVANIKSFDPSKKQVSTNLYDAALKTGKQTDIEGLISGNHLLSPEQTKHIWDKYYPSRKTVNHTGRHEFNTGDYVNKTGSSTVIDNGQVVDLNTPFQDISTKSTNMFHPDMIDKTTWTLKNPDWNDPSIFKIGIPAILGLNINYDLSNLE